MTDEYADWEELKSMRSITSTDQDLALQRAVTRASRAIDRACGRPEGAFSRTGTPTARSFSASGHVIRRDNTDILLVDDIADASTVTATLAGSPVSSLGFVGNEQPGQPVTGLALASWYGGTIVVTAEWGWPAIPASIEEATLLLANRRYMRKDSPEGTSGWSQEGAVGVSRFDQDIEDLVRPFVLYGFGS